MKVKELKQLLKKCNDESEIGINDFDGIYEIEGISTILYGTSGIDSMVYAIRTTQEIDDVVEINTSLIKNLEEENCNYMAEILKKYSRRNKNV